MTCNNNCEQHRATQQEGMILQCLRTVIQVAGVNICSRHCIEVATRPLAVPLELAATLSVMNSAMASAASVL